MALLISTGDGMSTRMDLVALSLSSGSVRPEECLVFICWNNFIWWKENVSDELKSNLMISFSMQF